jgi:uncharacterized protein (DUF1015 family)
MVKVKPFAAIRPPKAIAKEVSARPYDVMNSVEARAEAGEKSLLHITKPEIDFEPIAGEHEQRTYDKAVANYKLWKERGWLTRDAKECYYVYAQTMEGRTQYGIILCANTDDYATGAIKKHELTRKEKEDDRMIHVRIQNANIEPVFFAYPDNPEIDAIMFRYISHVPEYDFVADEDGFGHKLWVIDDDKDIARITEIFAGIPAFYVADGHHRTAAAARVGAEKRSQNPKHTGNEEYNYFMAVCFPDNQLKIIDYNRVVKDLNGLSGKQFFEALQKDFIVECKCDCTKDGGKCDCELPCHCTCSEPYKPSGLHNFSMYFEGVWYSLTAKPGTYNDADPIGVLDVTILSNLVFDKILNLGDLRTSNRIDFVGGIRGLGELKKRVDSGEMAVAFALYPVSMQQLINIADTGNIMPPKTTWFEPKLRSGLAIHELV